MPPSKKPANPSIKPHRKAKPADMRTKQDRGLTEDQLDQLADKVREQNLKAVEKQKVRAKSVYNEIAYRVGNNKTAKDKPRTSKKLAFLITYGKCGNMAQACREVGISYCSLSTWRKKDIKFANAMQRALSVYVCRLEEEAHRRGVDGVDEPIFHKGVVVGFKTRYSDLLLIKLLEAYAPEKYRERSIDIDEETLDTIAQAIAPRIGAEVERARSETIDAGSRQAAPNLPAPDSTNR
jgi:hypothetical protein